MRFGLFFSFPFLVCVLLAQRRGGGHEADVTALYCFYVSGCPTSGICSMCYISSSRGPREQREGYLLSSVMSTTRCSCWIVNHALDPRSEIFGSKNLTTVADGPRSLEDNRTGTHRPRHPWPLPHHGQCYNPLLASV